MKSLSSSRLVDLVAPAIEAVYWLEDHDISLEAVTLMCAERQRPEFLAALIYCKEELKDKLTEKIGERQGMTNRIGTEA